MRNEAAFLRALEETPEDTALRLVFADWLEERGDKRGELVRLVHTLTQAIDVPQRPELEARLQALLRQGVRPVGPYWTNSIGMRFAWIPAGTFRMGSPREEGGRRTSETPHAVSLTQGFWLGVYPVTQEQWRKVMGNNPSWFCAQGGGKEEVKRLNTKNFPVEMVNWDEAVKFCARLAKQEGLPREEYRLPSEAQWEYACRAGTQTPFHFGATCDGSEANCKGSRPSPSPGRTSVVGSYLANGFGLFDMHGNVSEWCSDWWERLYKRGKSSDPPGPQQGNVRVLRGGDWADHSSKARSASRDYHLPEFRTSTLGFRVVRRRARQAEQSGKA